MELEKLSNKDLERGVELALNGVDNILAKIAITNAVAELLRRLSRVQELEKDNGMLKAKLLASEEMVKELENQLAALQCCGNCKTETLNCPKVGTREKNNYCPSWTTDGLTREDRSE